MAQSWQSEAGRLACRWSEIGQREKYNPSWMQECTEVLCGHLPAIPDFLSHSPFGGVAWFQPNPADSE